MSDKENTVRFCPNCGHIGTVASRYVNCCPDGHDAREIPAKLAGQCQRLFKLAIGKQIAGTALCTCPPGALEMLKQLVEALDGALISTWQSTAAWQPQLDAAKAYIQRCEGDDDNG